MDDDNKAKWISTVSLVSLIAVAGWSYGFFVADQKVTPYEETKRAVDIATSLLTTGEVIGKGRRVKAPKGASRDLVTTHDPQAAMRSGYYAIYGWDNAQDGYTVHLIDTEGNLRHVWPIDETTFSTADTRQNGPHGMYVLPDGSVIVSMDFIGLMARLDACARPIWVRDDGYYHHAIGEGSDGGMWTWYGETSSYVQRQQIVKFDIATGEDIRRLDFLEDVVMRDAASAQLFSMTQDTRLRSDTHPRAVDLFHPNDVEELLPEMAGAFPMFAAGDLLISIREYDMIAVTSPEGAIKWTHQGPWRRQHDPDFLPDGTISVYNNARDLPNSTIYVVDPATDRVTLAFPGPDRPFKSEFRGKHQALPNGNYLLTVPSQGQVLEVTPDGRTVREFNNIVEEGSPFNEDVTNARWLPDDYFESFPACQG